MVFDGGHSRLTVKCCGVPNRRVRIAVDIQGQQMREYLWGCGARVAKPLDMYMLGKS